MAQSLRLKRPVITAILIFILFALLWFYYALFIGGPYRLHEQQLQQTEAHIYEQVSGLQGLEQNIFAYVTYQGYTDQELYWFDARGDLITSRPLSSLDYEKAQALALEKYDLIPEIITLAFGYSHPVYQLENDRQFLLLDYDTFQTVYLRYDTPEEFNG